eukprot:scaffold2345_cov148-Skeletonema_menzelii.AAC.1
MATCSRHHASSLDLFATPFVLQSIAIWRCAMLGFLASTWIIRHLLAILAGVLLLPQSLARQ